MSKNEFEAKFPGQTSDSDIPPSPTVENPGQVYPKSVPQPGQSPTKPSGGLTIGATAGDPASSATNITDPTRAPAKPLGTSIPIGNPYLMHEALEKVDVALGEIISLINSEFNGSVHTEPASHPATHDNGGSHPALHGSLQKFQGWRNEIGEMRCRTSGSGKSPTTISKEITETTAINDLSDQPTIGSSGGGEGLIRQEGGMFVD